MSRGLLLTATGSGIAPFFPVQTQASGFYLPAHCFLFLLRLPILITFTFTYFAILQWLPIGSLGKKASLWAILGVPSIWWIDLQIDGVKKGSLATHHQERLPQPGSIIASSHTSPIDSLYLAAIFDPIFTASYPSTRLVHRISLLQSILRAFQYPQQQPPSSANLVELQDILRQSPDRVVAVFPECTTTNGRGILPFSNSLLTSPANAKIFPISLRYTPPDITTPVPGTYLTFLWNLLSKPTHCIRVRIAESVFNMTQSDDTTSSTDTLLDSEDGNSKNSAERKLLHKIAEALARLGKVKTVGLDVRDKAGFIKAWSVNLS
ncbi:MAG: hypothetical protein HETSPECPRED_001641 [Heterodermia speciosa]|uniref:Phospholipid/glycerol acyltransferase domain-containing protein n=1 Tax=Heterodermia speciosa TaxID=116794 RepID=A0A8H3F0J5_9LECA|nr:MAG: hypothetical protein HETSPECPRED_001641 [Heterodermia speciosa]